MRTPSTSTTTRTPSTNSALDPCWLWYSVSRSRISRSSSAFSAFPSSGTRTFYLREKPGVGIQPPRVLATWAVDFMRKASVCTRLASKTLKRKELRLRRCALKKEADDMELLDRIETQLISNRLPLVAITVAAVPYANTPVVLTLHWHGFVETRLVESSDANIVAYQPVPSSALQINDRWDGLPQLENEVLDVAWELGSWDLARMEALPFVRPGASEQESLECMSAFGSLPLQIDGQPPVVAEVPDAEDLIATA